MHLKEPHDNIQIWFRDIKIQNLLSKCKNGDKIEFKYAEDNIPPSSHGMI